MGNNQYILDANGNPKPEPDVRAWGEWVQKADRRIALDKFDGVKVSTVFLGLDHNFGSGEPLVFETMVFGGPFDEECERYSTREQAIAGHAAMVAKVAPKP